MKKKGFTLVELLAVIAILAILVIMALPAVLRMFNNARRDSFTNEVNTIIRTARQQYLLSGGTDTTWSNASGSTNTLDLTGNSHLQYYVKMNNEGKITKLQVSNGDFQYNVTNNNGIDVASSSDVQEVTEGNELVINAGPNYLYYSNMRQIRIGNIIPDVSTFHNNYEDAIATWGHPYFIRVAVEDFSMNTWCIIDEASEYNSCHDVSPKYYSSESECNEVWQSWNIAEGYTFQCVNENLSGSQITDADVGFIKNGNVYYLKGADASAYESNKTILDEAFGSSNCNEQKGYEYECTSSEYNAIADGNGAITITKVERRSYTNFYYNCYINHEGYAACDSWA